MHFSCIRFTKTFFHISLEHSHCFYYSAQKFNEQNHFGGLVTKSYLTLVTPWTVARQAPPSIGFSRQEYWGGLPFSSHNHFLKSICISEVSWTFFEKCKCSAIVFFSLQSSRYVSNEQSCLKTTGLYDDHFILSSLFHFFYFILSTPISFSLFSNFSISSSFFFHILSPAFIKHSRKAFVVNSNKVVV